MAEMLLLNPRRRRKAKKAARRSNPKRRTARTSRRRRNPLPMFGRSRRIRPARVGRRRRNPITMGRLTGSSIIAAIKDAAIGAGGAIAFDMAWGKVAPMLPASLRPVAGKVGAGDAVKMLATIVVGRALKGATRGLSMRAASGALTVQAHGIIKKMMPPAMLAGIEDDGSAFSGSDYASMGYYSPSGGEDGSAVVGPAIDGYVTGSPLLNGLGEYTDGSGGVLLGMDDAGDAFSREGVSNYR